MMLRDDVHIARQFLRSIRIDTDLDDPKALEGFICPRTSAEVLLSMANHVEKTGQGAFTWTGPYGSGKSSLLVALSALLSGDNKLRQYASNKVFTKETANSIWKAMPTEKKGWRVVPVVGRREEPVQVIGEALQKTGLISHTSRRRWSEDRLIEVISETTKSVSKSHGGLIIFLDEMGKFLEGAAHDGSDIYIFQQLAELAARSRGRLLIIGVLHQAFEEYVHRLSREIRDEWAKVQGRFIDLAVVTTGEEQIDLIARAIETKRKVKKASSEASTVAKLIRQNETLASKNLALLLENCWPLHPVVACLLGPISRRRFGQNQRSIFGFLNSAEPHGFQDFIHKVRKGEIYQPHQLWDYLRVNLEASILASPDGHRWALAVDALERCEASNKGKLHLTLLKTISVIDLFKERSGIVPSRKILNICFSGVPQRNLGKALNELSKQSLIIFKKFLDSYAIYAGSDFDIDEAVKIALEDIGGVDFPMLKGLADLHPILAKRHYHQTGTMRWFDVNICSLRDAPEYSAKYKANDGAIGQFLLTIPSHGESKVVAEKLCREAARHSRQWDIIVGISPHSWTIVSLARELLVLGTVQRNHCELAGDVVARREIKSRVQTVTVQLETELRQAFDSARWYRKSHAPKTYHHAELNVIASDIADRRFNQSPKVHNELLNRQKPSTGAITARNALLRNMVLNEGSERLGIEGYPAEGGLFESLLEATKLYIPRKGGKWHFQGPEQDDPCRFAHVWEKTIEFIKSNQSRIIKVSELYDIWRQPPLGIKGGLMPVLATAFIVAEKKKLAIYRDEIFRAQFDDVDIDYLAKDASTIQLRWMDLSNTSKQTLKGMAEIVRDLDEVNKPIHLEPIDVARGLVGIYEQLPEWTKRTTHLSRDTRQIRDLFKRARDPNQFLFEDIPALIRTSGSNNKDNPKYVITSMRKGLGELVQAYPKMLHELRDNMLTELRVMNTTPQALSKLRERAENIRNLSGDFQLDAFIGRLSQFTGSDEGFESIASLAANKPPRNWTDPDLNKVAVDLADLSQRFVKAETFARVKGRKNKRRSIAVIIGMDEDRPSPLQKEFDIDISDNPTIKKVVKSVSDALDKADVHEHTLILAALAETIAKRITDSDGAKQKNKKKRVS